MEKVEHVIGAILIIIGVILNNKEVSTVWKKVLRNFLPHDSAIREQIKSIMDNLRSEIGAVRVNLWMFNNGITSEGGYSYKYASIVFETFSDDLKPIKKTFSNIPVEDYLSFLSRLRESNKYLTSDKNCSDPIIRGMFSVISMEYGIDFKLSDKNVYRGFVSVCFGHDINTEHEQQIIKKIEAAAAIINSKIKTMKRIN